MDVGGGTGHFAKTIKEMWGTDVYVTELKRDYVMEPGVIVKEVNLDCDSLPFPDGFFDYVTFIEIIEHLKNPWFVMGEIRRVLKEKGKLILTTPNVHNIRSKRYFVFKNYIEGFGSKIHRNPNEHLHPFTLTELELLLNENGFQIEKVIYDEGYLRKVPWLYYKTKENSRSVLRNFKSYILVNLLHFWSVLVSFILTGSFSTRNIFWGQTCVLVTIKRW